MVLRRCPDPGLVLAVERILQVRGLGGQGFDVLARGDGRRGMGELQAARSGCGADDRPAGG